jgi:drug/metabolite transporter (DMT)-like permease
MGILFGILAAFFDAFKNLFAKKSSLTSDSLVITWGSTVFSAAVLVPFMFVRGIPTLDTTFWVAVIVRTILDVGGTLLFFYSIKNTDLSLSLPLLAFSPLPLLIMGVVLNREIPGTLGIVGVGFIVTGIYILNYKKGGRFFDPILTVFRDKGSLAMFSVAMIWGVVSAIHKTGILHSNPFFYVGISSFFLAVGVTITVIAFERRNFVAFVKSSHLLRVAPVGIFDGIAYLFQIIGQSMALSVFVLSLKRSSMLLSSIFGWYYFKEPLGNRIFPIALMLTGVALVIVSM